jgi:hypothetical protein
MFKSSMANSIIEYNKCIKKVSAIKNKIWEYNKK